MKKSPFSPYVETIMEDFPALHFVAFTDDKMLAYDPETLRCQYFYEVNEEFSYHTDMLCNCREEYQAWCEEILESLHYQVVFDRDKCYDIFNLVEIKTP